VRDVLAQIQRWHEEGQALAVATVVRVGGSAPRPVGSRLVVTGDGDFAGSVSGGCVENAVIEEALGVLRDGRPRLLHYGISDELGWEVGLACGGTLDVWVQVADPAVWRRVAELVGRDLPAVLLTTLGEDERAGEQAVVVPDGAAPGFAVAEAVEEAFGLLADERAPAEPVVRTFAGGREVLIEPLRPAPQLVIVGGVHVARPLSALAQVMGFRVVIVDPRRAFADRKRFPAADRVLVQWPGAALQQLAVDPRTAIVVLTHDPKIDEPALVGALETPAFYIGAIGSRKTRAGRAERLIRAGVAPDRLGRIHGPIGLDLGGRSVEELALSILAEIIAVRNGRGGESLTLGTG
jgi:xanthine dehydrogenase accessory factor